MAFRYHAGLFRLRRAAVGYDAATGYQWTKRKGGWGGGREGHSCFFEDELTQTLRMIPSDTLGLSDLLGLVKLYEKMKKLPSTTLRQYMASGSANSPHRKASQRFRSNNVEKDIFSSDATSTTRLYEGIGDPLERFLVPDLAHGKPIKINIRQTKNSRESRPSGRRALTPWNLMLYSLVLFSLFISPVESIPNNRWVPERLELPLVEPRDVEVRALPEAHHVRLENAIPVVAERLFRPAVAAGRAYRTRQGPSPLFGTVSGLAMLLATVGWIVTWGLIDQGQNDLFYPVLAIGITWLLVTLAYGTTRYLRHRDDHQHHRFLLQLAIGAVAYVHLLGLSQGFTLVGSTVVIPPCLSFSLWMTTLSLDAQMPGMPRIP